MMLGRADDTPADTAKRLARHVVVASGRVRSRWRATPDFLIVGAQRCGTTSLHRALAAHPLVATPIAHKGVHYFDTGFAHGLPWYRAHFPTERALRARARRSPGLGSRMLVFESSPYYMFHPAGPQRIAAVLPECKVIVVLRDPVERAYSQYAHERARGYETVDTFEEAVDLEEERLVGEEERLLADPGYVSFPHQHQAYTRRSAYGPQLARLVAHLTAERVLVLDFDRLAHDSESTMSTVLRFLHLRDAPGVTLGHHNPRQRPGLASSTRSRLRRAFVESDRIVADLLGSPPSWVA